MKKIIEPLNNVIRSSKKIIIDKSLEKFDLVSREEFEVQKKILLKTRIKIEEIDKKLDLLLSNKDKYD